MPSLKTSEKRLLAGFLVAVFAVANFLLYRQVSKVQGRAEAEVRKLNLKLLEMSDLLAEKDVWDARREWLAANQPVFDPSGQNGKDESQINLELLEAIRSTSQKFGLTLEAEKPLEGAERGLSYQAGMRVNAVGDMESVVRWLYELQRPDQFRAVTFLELKPEKDDPSVLHCEVQVERWYARAGGQGT